MSHIHINHQISVCSVQMEIQSLGVYVVVSLPPSPSRPPSTVLYACFPWVLLAYPATPLCRVSGRLRSARTHGAAHGCHAPPPESGGASSEPGSRRVRAVRRRMRAAAHGRLLWMRRQRGDYVPSGQPPGPSGGCGERLPNSLHLCLLQLWPRRFAPSCSSPTCLYVSVAEVWWCVFSDFSSDSVHGQ